MSKIAIVYGTSTGTTEEIAKKIHAQLPQADIYNVDDTAVEDLLPYDFYILGTSTTGVGDLLDEWEAFLPRFSKLYFTGKKAAIFGLGDSASFSTSYAEGMFQLHKALKGKLEFVGQVSADDYSFEETQSVVNGKFLGLALDEDNEYAKTDARIASWLADLKKYFGIGV